MTDERRHGWDDAAQDAWDGLRQRLADALAGLVEDDSVLLGLPDEHLHGAGGYVQVLAWSGLLRVEVSSNVVLDASCRLDARQESALRGLGLAVPDDDHGPNFWLDLEQREADRAAWLVVGALRDVLGVLHPLLLEGEEGVVGDDGPVPDPLEDAGDGEDGDEPDGPVGAMVRAADLPPLVGDGPWHPTTSDEVRAMLLHAAAPLVVDAPALDEDGDLSIGAGSCVLWATVAARAPRVLLTGVLVRDVADQQRALLEVNLLNQREVGLSFVLQEGRISVRRELGVSHFSSPQVRAEMERLLDDLERWSGDLVARVGGRAPYDDETYEPLLRPRAAAEDSLQDRLVAALGVLRELEREDRDGLGPGLLLDVFHADRALLMGAIKETREQEEDWTLRARRAEEEGRTQYARTCRARCRYQRGLRSRLRGALRLAVQHAPRGPIDGRDGRDQQQLALFSEDEASA